MKLLELAKRLNLARTVGQRGRSTIQINIHSSTEEPVEVRIVSWIQDEGHKDHQTIEGALEYIRKAPVTSDEEIED